MKRYGKYLPDVNHERDHAAIVDEINKFSQEPIEVTITATSTEHAVAHKLDRVPSFFFCVVTKTTTVPSGLYPTATAWTDKYIYVQAAATGVYHIILRK